MPQPEAAWISRFAQRLLQVQPDLRPLDAVRNATSAFADSPQLAPEEAVEAYLSSTAASQREQAAAGRGAQGAANSSSRRANS